MSNALAAITALSTQTVDPNAAVQRRNFARSAEALAEANAPGFRDYLASTSSAPKTDNVVVVQNPNVNHTGPHMDFEDSDFTWSDVGDALNPLQHIPVVGTLYRHFSGGSPKPSAQAMGDMLYGGAIGGLASMGLALVNALSGVTSDSGKPADMQLAEAILGPTSPTSIDAQPTAVADAKTETKIDAPTTTLASAEKPAEKAQETIIASAAPTNNTDDYVSVKIQSPSGLRKTAQFYQIKRAPAATAPAPTEPAPTEPAPTEPAAPTTDADATPTKTEKQPYGGVLDPMPYQRAAALRGTGATVMGNTIYAREHFGLRTAYASEKKAAPAPVPSPTATTAAPEPTPPTFTPTADSAALGQLMHDSAHQAQTAAQTTGAANVLPPELIQDMMTMALEKYNASSRLSVD